MSDRDSWWLEAGCRDQPSEIFFPERGEVPFEARAICDVCPVHDECLTFALDFPEGTLLGVWAGTSPKQRRNMRRKRRVSA